MLWGTQRTVATGYKHPNFVMALQVYQLGGLGHALPCMGGLSVMVTAKSLPERRVLCVWTQQGACGSIILGSLGPTLLRVRVTEQAVEVARKALGRFPVWGGGEVRELSGDLEARHIHAPPPPPVQGTEPPKNLPQSIPKWHFWVLVPYVYAIPSITPRTHPQDIWV